MDQLTSNKVTVIKNLYFYLVSFVALMMVVFSLADLINLGLKTWVFTKADNYGYYGPVACTLPTTKSEDKLQVPDIQDCNKQQAEQKKAQEESNLAQKQRDAVRDISMIVVGTPLFILHWTVVRRKEV